MPPPALSCDSVTGHLVLAAAAIGSCTVSLLRIFGGADRPALLAVVATFAWAAIVTMYFATCVAHRCEVEQGELRCVGFIRTWTADLHDVESMVIRDRLIVRKQGVITLRDGARIYVIIDFGSRFRRFAADVHAQAPWVDVGR